MKKGNIMRHFLDTFSAVEVDFLNNIIIL